MNTSIPNEAPKDYEKEIDAMLAGIVEMLANIRRNREEGAVIMAEADAIRADNAIAAKRLDDMIARWK